jgi:hypothetical protein
LSISRFERLGVVPVENRDEVVVRAGDEGRHVRGAHHERIAEKRLDVLRKRDVLVASVKLSGEQVVDLHAAGEAVEDRLQRPVLVTLQIRVYCDDERRVRRNVGERRLEWTARAVVAAAAARAGERTQAECRCEQAPHRGAL